MLTVIASQLVANGFSRWMVRDYHPFGLSHKNIEMLMESRMGIMKNHCLDHPWPKLLLRFSPSFLEIWKVYCCIHCAAMGICQNMISNRSSCKLRCKTCRHALHASHLEKLFHLWEDSHTSAGKKKLTQLERVPTISSQPTIWYVNFYQHTHTHW